MGNFLLKDKEGSDHYLRYFLKGTEDNNRRSCYQVSILALYYPQSYGQNTIRAN